MQPKTKFGIFTVLAFGTLGLSLAGFGPAVLLVPGLASICFAGSIAIDNITSTVRSSVSDVTSTIAQNNADKLDLKAQLLQKDAIILAHGLEVDKLNSTIDEAVTIASGYRERCIDVDLQCGYCGTIQTIEFNPNVPEFVCDHCQQTNAISTRISVSRITEGFDSAVDNLISPLS